MNSTQIYWNPPKEYFKQTFLQPVANTLGFWVEIPPPDPVTSGWYFGEGRENVFGDRNLSFDTRPEIYAIDNTIRPGFKSSAEYMKIDRSKGRVRI